MLSRQIILITTSESICKTFRDEGFNAVCDDVKNIEPRPFRTYVSPGNSLGFMDGGIDKAFMDMFPGIQTRVKTVMVECPYETNLGRSYLPIGTAAWIPMPNIESTDSWMVGTTTTRESTKFIAAPTMWLPQDVSATRNAYYATKAAYTLWRKTRMATDEIILPAMCCGYGKMPVLESAKQMKRAIEEVEASVEQGTFTSSIYGFEHSISMLVDIEKEQSLEYMNREFQNCLLTKPIKYYTSY